VVVILLTGFALVVGVAAAVASFAQARRILRRRSSDDVSLWWLGLYSAGCVVWIAYGISIGSAPLVASQSVALAGSATATVLALRFRRFDGHPSWVSKPLLRRLRAEEQRPSSAPRIGDVMRPAPSAVLDELVVEEASRGFFRGPAQGEPTVLPVVDRHGRAVGILRCADIAALPPADRASRLVAQLADRDAAVIAWTGLDAGRVLARPAVARAGFALATDRRRRLVGVAWCMASAAGHNPGVTDSASEAFGLSSDPRRRSPQRDAPRRAPADSAQPPH
jgi:MtN3 and saliva related transmembrane protein